MAEASSRLGHVEAQEPNLASPTGPSHTELTRDYKQHEGAAVFTYINNRLITHVDRMPLKKIRNANYRPRGDRPNPREYEPTEGAMALHAVAMTLNKPYYRLRSEQETIRDISNLDPGTLMRMRHHTSIDSGLADTDFVGHFAPAVAAGIVDLFTRSDVLSSKQHESFTLTDYANVIGTGWFSAIMHDLARTSNGAYGGHGRESYSYTYNALTQLFERTLRLKASDTAFTVKETLEPEDGYIYHAAQTTAALRLALRQRLRKNSVASTRGCPVARHNVTLDTALIESSPPLQHFLESDEIVASGKELRSTDRQHYILPHSAIDLSLIQLADRLIRYDDRFGTPRPTLSWTTSLLKWRHRYMAPQDALRYKRSDT